MGFAGCNSLIGVFLGSIWMWGLPRFVGWDFLGWLVYWSEFACWGLLGQVCLVIFTK